MNKFVLFVAFVAFVVATPRSLQVQKDLHEVAKSVKTSSDYGLEEKREILATLKEMNTEAKEFDHASSHRKAEIKHELQEQLSQLKESMHEEVASKEFEEDDEEEDVETAQKKIDAVGHSLEEVKADFESKSLSHHNKERANKLISKLETQYESLSASSSRASRKLVAKEMKEIVSELKTILPEETKTKTSTKSHHFEEEEEKKQKVLADIDNVESELQSAHLSSGDREAAQDILAEMRSEISSQSNMRELKVALQSKMNQLESIMEGQEAEGSHHNKDKAAQIREDVKEVERSLESEHLSASAKKIVKSALHSIDKQATQYESADVDEKSEIRASMKREMAKIKREMEQKEEVDLEEDEDDEDI